MAAFRRPVGLRGWRKKMAAFRRPVGLRGWRKTARGDLNRKFAMDRTRAKREKAPRMAQEHCGGPIENRAECTSRLWEGWNPRKVSKIKHFQAKSTPSPLLLWTSECRVGKTTHPPLPPLYNDAVLAKGLAQDTYSVKNGTSSLLQDPQLPGRVTSTTKILGNRMDG